MPVVTNGRIVHFGKRIPTSPTKFGIVEMLRWVGEKAFPCFQWMFAPKGCGFLWVNPINQQFIHPLITSHNYEMPFPDEFHTRVSSNGGNSIYNEHSVRSMKNVHWKSNSSVVQVKTMWRMPCDENVLDIFKKKIHGAISSKTREWHFLENESFWHT